MSIRTKDPKPSTRPSWEDYWQTVGNETYLYARELIDLSPDVRAHFAGFIAWRDRPVMVDVPGRPSWDPGEPDPEGWVLRDVELDWQAAAKSADEWPASSTQRRLLSLVLSLVNPDEEGHHETVRDEEGPYEVWRTTGTRLFDARDLGSMGSWRDDVAEILARFITGQPPTPPPAPQPSEAWMETPEAEEAMWREVEQNPDF